MAGYLAKQLDDRDLEPGQGEEWKAYQVFYAAITGKKLQASPKSAKKSGKGSKRKSTGSVRKFPSQGMPADLPCIRDDVLLVRQRIGLSPAGRSCNVTLPPLTMALQW